MRGLRFGGVGVKSKAQGSSSYRLCKASGGICSERRDRKERTINHGGGLI